MTDADRETQLLADLGRVLDLIDGPHRADREIARGLFTWRALDAELADLVFDSVIDQPEVLVRSSDAGLRTLSFSTGSVTVEIDISNGRLIGQVVPAQRTLVELLQHSGQLSASTESDDLGVFTFGDVGRGASALVCQATDGAWSVRTNWIVL